MNIFARMTHSLSARLLVIFVLASFAYSYAVRNAVQVFNDTDWLRQIVGAHIALHTEYVLGDIGVPPNIERAMEIVAQIPIDIRIVGPDQDWGSDPDFPDLAGLNPDITLVPIAELMPFHHRTDAGLRVKRLKKLSSSGELVLI